MADDLQTPNPAQADNQQFAIQRIYLKDASVETPGAPEIFKEKWQPKIQLDVNNQAKSIGGDLQEVVLKITVTALQNDKPVLLIEVQQAGLFLCKGIGEEQLGVIISTICSEILFPYAREAIDNLAVKASFPPFALAPMNFKALYQQAQMQQAQAQAEAAVSSSH